MTTLLKVNFGSAPLGAYSREQVERDFGTIEFCEGLNRVSVVDAPGAPSGRALAVAYPSGGVGPRVGGAQWRVRLPSSHQGLYASYALCFAPGFDFVKGGKLPGLVGGKANTGGYRPNGRDGFSARMMWRAGGRMVQYVYHPDQPSIWGEDFAYVCKSPLLFAPGRWQRVQHYVRLNSPGQPGAYNGVLKGWCDGELALERAGLRFRDSAAILIDQFFFSTFFGGNEADWAPVKNESVWFDEFCVSTEPILF